MQIHFNNPILSAEYEARLKIRKVQHDIEAEIDKFDRLFRTSAQETRQRTAPSPVAELNFEITFTDHSNRSQFDSAIERASDKYGVPAALIRSVIRAESDFDPHAVSSAGAMGLMQLMPSTAAALGVSDPFNPSENIDAGTKYLKEMIDRFQDIRKALAAYNAGPGNVNKYDGIPPFEETQNYVNKVLTYFNAP